MDLLGHIDVTMKTLIGVATFVGIVVTFFKWVLPKWRQIKADVRAGRDALVGRDAVHDSITGREISPALPGMGVRMATTESQMTMLTEAVTKIADSHERVDRLSKIAGELDRRVTLLEAGSVERVVTRAESASAWRAVEAIANGATEPPRDETLPGLGEN